MVRMLIDVPSQTTGVPVFHVGFKGGKVEGKQREISLWWEGEMSVFSFPRLHGTFQEQLFEIHICEKAFKKHPYSERLKSEDGDF